MMRQLRVFTLFISFLALSALSFHFHADASKSVKQSGRDCAICHLIVYHEGAANHHETPYKIETKLFLRDQAISFQYLRLNGDLPRAPPAA